MWWALYWSWLNNTLPWYIAGVLLLLWLLIRPRRLRLEPGEAPPLVEPRPSPGRVIATRTVLALAGVLVIWGLVCTIALGPLIRHHLTSAGVAGSANVFLFDPREDRLTVDIRNADGPVATARIDAGRVLGLPADQARAWRGERQIRYLPGHPLCLTVTG